MMTTTLTAEETRKLTGDTNLSLEEICPEVIQRINDRIRENASACNYSVYLSSDDVISELWGQLIDYYKSFGYQISKVCDFNDQYLKISWAK